MIDAIARTLIHSLWQGLAIALLLACALHFLKTSAARYAASCLALLSMLGASAVTLFEFARPLAPGIANPNSNPPQTSISNLFPPELYSPADRFLPWITAAWLLGVFLLSARWITSWAWLQLRVRSAGSNLPPQILATVAALRTRLQVSRQILVRSADWIASPAVTGWLRPTLLLPASAITGLDPDQLTALLAHELAHIRRYDYFANLIQTAIETLLFYHPAVWWISTRIRIERENCCDDIAISVCNDRLIYARALVALEQTRTTRVALAPAATGASLKQRIRRILAQPEPSTTAWPAAAIAMLVFAFALWNAPKIIAQSSDLQPRHETWLKETAVYIITPQERAAFVALTSDEERDRFIEQFWQRRSPHPETPNHNEFRWEHYRRFAYANERFAERGTSGWKTDRGRIYIVYGPPDEIEIHHDTHLEQWLYHYIPGVGANVIMDFVDGRMTKDPNPPR